MKVAVVGVTGMVGQIVLRVLEENGLSITKLIPVASSKSIGKSIEYCGQKLTVVGMEEALLEQPEILLSSRQEEHTSLEWAPKFAACGTTVIDNSSAWRMDPSKKLIVPEINGASLSSDKSDKIIPNPNCSTIQIGFGSKTIA